MEKIKKQLIKQGHRFAGKNSVVKICRWTQKSLVDKGVCYKEKFYGIKSHLCCQMSPFLGCQNKCLHCWRPIEIDFSKVVDSKKVDSPTEIINNCIKQQRKLLSGFKGNSQVNQQKLKEAWEPNQFAISLIGEPTLYPKIGELINELRKRDKTSFLVTNGLCPDVLKRLSKKKQLPTQIYISLNSPNKKLYGKWHQSCVKNAWEKFNKSLELMKNLNCRTVIRMTLVKDLNMKSEMIKNYIKLIKKANPDFIELKGFMSVGFSRKRLGYEMMPRYKEVKNFSERLVKALGNEYKILDGHERSAVVLIGKDKKKMKIKEGEI